MTMTTTKPVEVFRSNGESLTTDLVLEVPCSGMGAIEGKLAYTAAPASAPTLEFSMNNVDWDSAQSATLDGTAVTVTLYQFDKIKVSDWKFARITIPLIAAPDVVRGGVRILPVEEA